MNPNKLLPGSGTSSDDSNTSAEISRIKKKSALTMLFFFMVFGGWSVLASISGAVIASGFVVVETNARSIQHLTGGIVERIFVTEGERVKAGSLLVKLNETQIRAQLQIQANEVDELLIRQVGPDWINRNRNRKSRTRCARFPSYRTTRCTCPNTLTVSSGSRLR